MKHNLETYNYLFSEISNGDPIWSVAIYVRLSKADKKNKSVSESIVNQLRFASIFLRNFRDFYLYDIYIDDGRTGTDFNRNDYQRLQQDIDNKFVNCMIVRDLTRFVRNLSDGIITLDSYVLEKHVRFISIENPVVDTHIDPHAISSPEVYSSLQGSEDFARTTSLKVRGVQEVKIEFGEPVGGFPPYGYLKNPDTTKKNYVIDETASKIIEDIFLWKADGMSINEIAKKLNSANIPNPTAYKRNVLKLNYKGRHGDSNSGLWSSTTVSRILENKTYIGSMVQHKTTSFDHKRHKRIQVNKNDYVVRDNKHARAVSDELFKSVQKEGKRTRSQKNGKVHIFANHIYCSNCKKAMKKTSSKNYEYLVCRTYREFGKEYCDKKRTISFQTLENIVLNMIKEQINMVINLQEIVSKINQQKVTNNKSVRLSNMIQDLDNEIKKATHIIDSSYYDWKNNDISKEQYQRVRSETEQKLKQLQSSLRLLHIQETEFELNIKTNNKYFERFLKYKNIECLDRIVIVELIDKIYVDENKNIEIIFSYEDQYLLILDYIQQNLEQSEKKNIEEQQVQKIFKK